MPYYELRKECFDYIDANHLDYNDLSGGFNFYGNRGFIELVNDGKIVGNERNRKYFIYSNISNLGDELIDELHDLNRWTAIRTFSKGSVFITIYKNTQNQ
ncbi:hypothetical protein AGMMS50262_17280 [Bacteroidia bacterium]|nr:hypothetical protein AGMMS50262_17280 [Bacteroidia bacterium]